MARVIQIIALSVLILTSWADTAHAVASFTLSGRAGSSTAPLLASSTRSGSGTVDFDLGQYFRLGFTYQQDYTTKEGMTKVVDNGETKYTDYSERSMFTMKSVDLTIILYQGDVFIPYIFGGVARIESKTKIVYAEKEPENNESVAPIVPTGGAGFGLRLNKQFTLKFSNRWMPGVQQTAPDGKQEAVVDSQMQVGVSYSM